LDEHRARINPLQPALDDFVNQATSESREMTQIQLTTREAVEIALGSIKGWIDADGHIFQDEAEKARAAMKILCDLYGFKLEQFFGTAGAKEN
jgi:hypothetical protein